MRRLGQVGARAGDGVGEIDDGIVLVGGAEAHPAVHELRAGPQAGLHLRRVGPGQDADHLAGQLGGGVGRPGVQGAAVHHLHGGGLGGLVQGAVGHVVAVGGDDADGAVLGRQAQLLRQRLADVGDGVGGQHLGGDQIACHTITSFVDGRPAYMPALRPKYRPLQGRHTWRPPAVSADQCRWPSFPAWCESTPRCGRPPRPVRQAARGPQRHFHLLGRSESARHQGFALRAKRLSALARAPLCGAPWRRAHVIQRRSIPLAFLSSMV